jgi:hypothetical protein
MGSQPIQPANSTGTDLSTGNSTQFVAAAGARTTALIEPDRLCVFSPVHKGVLDLRGA